MIIATSDEEMAINRMLLARIFWLSSSVFNDDPIMMQTMKQENTKPKGHLAPAESRIGVQRKTKMYMTDSNMD